MPKSLEIKEGDTSVTFVDTAGLNDSNGPLVEIINSFITKTVYAQAKSVKFLVPISFY